MSLVTCPVTMAPPQLCGSSLWYLVEVCRGGRSWELSVARGKEAGKLSPSNMFSGEELRRCFKKLHFLIFSFFKYLDLPWLKA